MLPREVGSCEAIQGLTKLYKAHGLQGKARPSKASQSLIKPYEAMGLQGRTRPYKTIRGLLKPYKAQGLQGKARPCKTSQGLMGPFNTQRMQGTSDASQGHSHDFLYISMFFYEYSYSLKKPYSALQNLIKPHQIL